MAESDGTAPRVDLLTRQMQLIYTSNRLTGEGFIQLEKVDVINREFVVL